ncbi:MAG: ZIP family metal transporter [Planctomycetota bacterium]|nr:ZIP family metal transporter [Planctomycetota bacterium]
MIEQFGSLHPVAQALVATLFTWGLTALGASPVLFTVRFSRKIMDGMLGLASGVMIAASYWSLLAPAIEMSGGAWYPAVIGFLAGGMFLYGVDKVLPHLHEGLKLEDAEGIKTSWRRSVLLVLAVTLHNIPEGLAVGVAFGAAHHGLESATTGAAVALAIGIGLQNCPEGLAVSMPLRREGMGRLKAFFFGQASGIVEPIAGIVGAAAVMGAKGILPYALAFAAGAMIFVVVEELIPESQREGNSDFATLGAIFGFALMMTLDVALG